MTLEKMIENDTTLDEFVEACMMQGMTEDEALEKWEEVFKVDDYAFQTAIADALAKGHNLKFTT